jgi:hypothetical protein
MVGLATDGKVPVFIAGSDLGIGKRIGVNFVVLFVCAPLRFPAPDV